MTSLASSFALPPHGSTSHLHKNNIVETKERKKYAAVDTVPPVSLPLSLPRNNSQQSVSSIDQQKKRTRKPKEEEEKERSLEEDDGPMDSPPSPSSSPPGLFVRSER
jgi:hypothetical protein